MDTADSDAFAAVWAQIRQWPSPKQLELATEILHRLRGESPRPRKTLADLVGLLAGNGPPPSDRQIEQILDEHRTRTHCPHPVCLACSTV